MSTNKKEKKLFGNLDKKQIQDYFDFFDKSNLQELSIEEDDAKLTLRKKKTVSFNNAAQNVAEQKETVVSQDNSPPKEEKIEDSGQKVIAPIIGTFYQSSSPDAPAFVKIGDLVKKGDTLCIVEAMKIMNEISSPFSGKVSQIKIQNGDTIQEGQVLFIIS